MYEYVPLEGGISKKPTEKTKKPKNTGSNSAAAVPVTLPVVDSAFLAPAVYDPESDTGYRAALAALEEISAAAPEYEASYEGLLRELYDGIAGRDPFSYDPEGDALYRQYRQQYTTLGRLAMEDTMGQAAGLTGGYGSTYAQNAGQQAYGAYLQQLNDKLPELYAMALDRYDREGQALFDRYDLVAEQADREYSAYRDAYQRWLTERNAAQSRADEAYDRGRQAWQDDNKLRQQSYDQLAELISKTGYNPSDERLAYAGMTRAQANALYNRYLRTGGK